MAYPLAPWVGQPADPAAHYQAGFQIGARLGAEQAANQYRQQQLLLEQQKQAFEQQYAMQKQALEIGDIIQKQRATAAYQGLVSQGADPMQALAMVGPSMGMDPTRAMVFEESRMMRQQQMQASEQEKARRFQLAQRTQAFREAQAEKPKSYVAEREREALAQLKSQASDLESRLKTDPTNQALKTQQQDVLGRIETWYNQHPGGQQMNVTLDSEGRLQGFTMGTGKIQPGAQSAVQREMADLKNSVVQIERAKNLITEKDVGVAGVVWDDLLNRWVSQVVPEAGDPSVSSNRVQLQKAADTYLQTQTAKGRLSVGEREDIRNALVSRKAGEALPRARQVLDAMSKIQKFDAITKAKTIQQPLEGWMFQGLTQEEIAQLIREAILTPNEGLEWAKKATVKRRTF